jgi:DNA-directed RNA polymerase specialized sigma24 family protein
MSNQDQELFEDLKRGNELALKAIYRENQEIFRCWAIKLCKDKYAVRISSDDAIELFHNSILIFYQKIKIGKLPALTCSIKTYLFGVGINLIKQFVDKEKRKIRVKDLESAIPFVIVEEIMLIDHVKIDSVLDEVGDECKKLLQLVFWDNLKFKEIGQYLGNKTDGAARKAKFDCLKVLNRIVKQRNLTFEFFLTERMLAENEYTG